MAGWTPSDLAGRANVAIEAIADAERSDGALGVTIRYEQAIRSALKAVGIEFTNAGGPGVRLRSYGHPDEGLRPHELTSENYG
jgi:hypothetical protein